MRPALVAQLRTAIARPLTLVVAPAGFGKTTLLAQSLTTLHSCASGLAHARAERRCPGRLPRRPVRRPNTGRARLPRQTGVLLQLPYRVDPAHVLDQLLSDLAGYSAIRRHRARRLPCVGGSCGASARRTPDRTRPTLGACRDCQPHEPPLPLARLRARGLLAEVREQSCASGKLTRPSSCALPAASPSTMPTPRY